MPKFRQTERLGCWVTWVKEVDAENESQAWDKFNDGEGTLISETIGDSIDGYDESDVSLVTELEPTGAIMPDGTKLDQWDERLRTAGGVPTYDPPIPKAALDNLSGTPLLGELPEHSDLCKYGGYCPRCGTPP